MRFKVNEKALSEFEEKRAAQIRPEGEAIEKEMYALLDKLDFGLCAFHYDGHYWTTMPLEEEETNYILIGLLIKTVARTFNKSIGEVMRAIRAETWRIKQ